MPNRILNDDYGFLDSIDCDCLEYLYKTEVYLWREQETGVPVPEEVATKRAQAWVTLEGKL